MSLERELLLFRRLELGLELLHYLGVLLGRLEQRRTPLVSLLLRRLPLRLLQRCSELVHGALTLYERLLLSLRRVLQHALPALLVARASHFGRLHNLLLRHRPERGDVASVTDGQLAHVREALLVLAHLLTEPFFFGLATLEERVAFEERARETQPSIDARRLDQRG